MWYFWSRVVWLGIMLFGLVGDIGMCVMKNPNMFPALFKTALIVGILGYIVFTINDKRWR